MIPQGVAAVVAFFLFVAPGLTWELTGERSRPSLSSSPFREAARVALTSVIFSAAALGVLALIRALWPRYMPDIGKWLDHKDYPHYLASSHQIIFQAVILEVAIVCGLAALIQFLRSLRTPTWLRRPATRLGAARSWMRSKRKPQRVIQRPTLWTMIHTSGAEADDIPVLAVRMKDGTAWSGDVSAIGHFDTRADSDIALQGDIWVSRENGGPTQLDNPPWARVVLPMCEVIEVAVGWRKPNPGEEHHPIG